MSEETMEPRTFEDLWLMRETSKEWFDGQLRYENVRKGADPEVGMVDSMSWHVVPFSDRVNVELHTHVIEEVRQNGHSMSLRTKLETLASYDTMEAFRASEWWDLTMERFAGGDADASWLRTVVPSVLRIVAECCERSSWTARRSESSSRGWGTGPTSRCPWRLETGTETGWATTGRARVTTPWT